MVSTNVSQDMTCYCLKDKNPFENASKDVERSNGDAVLLTVRGIHSRKLQIRMQKKRTVHEI